MAFPEQRARRLRRTPAAARAAASGPGVLSPGGTRSTRRPASRAARAVASPMQATRARASAPASGVAKRTALADVYTIQS